MAFGKLSAAVLAIALSVTACGPSGDVCNGRITCRGPHSSFADMKDHARAVARQERIDALDPRIQKCLTMPKCRVLFV